MISGLVLIFTVLNVRIKFRVDNKQSESQESYNKFSDVKGAYEAKEELKNVVESLTTLKSF